ncbi:putative glycosyltransferase EpsJ [Peptoclostridium acidaminophilum DSM 3953]|uniref:Putative glycosyltransferase EpsJ n=1 Tax=Peptoclostridium acidaminophilum DSM 3953 TaxID=1286171 RepID=W8TLX7_PEPAC|nr:glycosyltransferase [Peptoclostridium acidaminophilum]AHM57177.1 putative glycosyltransferase EpsJ [Peptoclostridium acidaminophilum DSM 3953]
MEAIISVVVPIFSNEKYLRRCLDSIVNQTYENLEIILVDDGSTDGSGAICDEYESRDKRIKVLHQTNQGVSAARNAGLKECQGEYIGFVDGDDWIEKDMFSFLSGLLEENGADMAACGYYLNDKEDPDLDMERPPEIITQESAIEKSLELKEFCFDSSVYNKIYRIDIYKKNGIEFDEDIAIGEDMLWLCRFIICSEKIVYSQIPKYHVIKNDESATRKPFNTKNISLVTAHQRLEAAVGGIYPQLVPVIRRRSALSSYRLLREASKNISAKNIADIRILQKDMKKKITYMLKTRELPIKGKFAAVLAMFSIAGYKYLSRFHEAVIRFFH